ncbi:MAG: aldehyde dehydrogenase family protein, partial [Porticoccaceae bacterium]|nr:aldehyde dehydrogenase family protein [Porticoccaceae bacterium]
MLSPRDGKPLTTIANGGAGDIDLAVASARKSFNQGSWSQMAPAGRKKILIKLAELIEAHAYKLAVLGVRDNGTEISMALKAEPGSAADTFRYYGEAVDKVYGEIAPTANNVVALIERGPIGVVGVIVPWNFPLMIGAWKIAPALLWGNTIVWKPASDIPAISHAFAKLFHDAGVPAGVLNLILASGRVASAMVQSPHVGALSFTGSVPVGKIISEAAIARGVKVQLELGGHNAAIVMPDVDSVFAAKQLTVGAMSGSGQKCTATRRIITVGDAHESFVAALRSEVEALVVGPGGQAGVTTGP